MILRLFSATPWTNMIILRKGIDEQVQVWIQALQLRDAHAFTLRSPY
jgi:hypothetical protein